MNNSNSRVWISATFPMALADTYRTILRTEFDRFVDEEAWQRNIAAAMIYSTLGLAGGALRRRR